MAQTTILGVRMDVLEKKEITERLRLFLLSEKPHAVYTPNPEMLVQAHGNSHMKRILNASDLNICDGFGITLASAWSKKIPTIPRYPGSDCMIDLCRMAEKLGKSVYLLGTGNDATLVKAKEQLQKKFPTLRIAGFHPGIRISSFRNGICAVNKDENERMIGEIISASPDILFVAFGHGKQEWWIDAYIQQLPSVRVAMGIGGSIDAIAQEIRRGPRLLRSLGLEWAWRLLLQPWRIKRILTAVIVFPYLYFFKSNQY